MALPDIKRVAVIGAGISGVCTAAHLLKQGIDVTVFERCSIAGGVWHFNENVADEPTYPNEIPSRGDYERLPPRAFDAEYPTPPTTPEGHTEKTSSKIDRSGLEHVATRELHAPPGPCYAGLKNNVPIPLMKTTLADWPSGLDDFVNQRYLERYIQHIAAVTGVEDRTLFDTRIDHVQKIGEQWRVLSVTRAQSDSEAIAEVRKEERYFDAVVVASGHYHMPRVPEFPGLAEWKARYPDRVSHSKRYRRAETLKDKTVLLVGAGTSSSDIAKELAEVAKHVYQSSRGGTYDHPAANLPANGTRIGAIKSFELDETHERSESEHIAGRVNLQNGQQLCNIDQVILCTGYVTSYPFLPQLHDDETPAESADENVLVTREGNMAHNLYQDIFYIQDPTLVFIGVPYHTATFSLFEFQAQAVARVLAGVADLPSQEVMREWYTDRVKLKGINRDFHSLRARGHEVEYVAGLVALANHGNRANEVEAMQGHSEEWLTKYQAFRDMIEKRLFLKASEDAETPGKVSAADIC